jgi:hypothetical protein
MDLHISGPKPDWEDIAPEDRNIHQRVAAATDGWGTIANLLGVVKVGLNTSACLDIHRSKGKELVKPLIKFTAEAFWILQMAGSPIKLKLKAPKAS